MATKWNSKKIKKKNVVAGHLAGISVSFVRKYVNKILASGFRFPILTKRHCYVCF